MWNTIYEISPAHYERYIEVFGGGGWVLFGRLPDPRGDGGLQRFQLKPDKPLFLRQEPYHGFFTSAGFPSIKQPGRVSCSAQVLRNCKLVNAVGSGCCLNPDFLVGVFCDGKNVRNPDSVQLTLMGGPYCGMKTRLFEPNSTY